RRYREDRAEAPGSVPPTAAQRAPPARWQRVSLAASTARFPVGLRPGTGSHHRVKFGQTSRSLVLRDLDQVAVGIAEIDRHHRPERALALDRAKLDGDAAGLDVAHDLLERRLGDEAEIAGADRDMRRLGLKLPARHVEVDLLPAKGDGGRPLAVGRRRHHAGAQHALIEAERRLEVAHGEHDMIEAVDDEADAHSAGAVMGSAAARALSRGRNSAAATMIA